MNNDDLTYDDGYEEGHDEGYEEGYDDGYNAGLNTGSPSRDDLEIVRAFLEAVNLGVPDTANEALAALARMEDCK